MTRFWLHPHFIYKWTEGTFERKKSHGESTSPSIKRNSSILQKHLILDYKKYQRNAECVFEIPREVKF